MIGGPYFDDLRRGQVFDAAPSMTLTPGVAALHQAILGDRLRLPLDAQLTRAVTGATAPLAHPALVCDVAIGQSTLATQRVIANLFYRGLVFFRFPAIGDTLFTRTEVVGLKQNLTKPGRPPTGLAALRVTAIDQVDRLVLDFCRCAMLPLSPGAAGTGHHDDLSGIGSQAPGCQGAAAPSSPQLVLGAVRQPSRVAAGRVAPHRSARRARPGTARVCTRRHLDQAAGSMPRRCCVRG